jgi:hypothetical protein
MVQRDIAERPEHEKRDPAFLLQSRQFGGQADDRKFKPSYG